MQNTSAKVQIKTNKHQKRQEIVARKKFKLSVKRLIAN